MPARITASTTEMSAYVALVMKFFVPLSTQSLPSRTAVVRKPPASLPEPGSVSPHAPIHSPEVSLGSHFFFCASLPAR
ncbi:hypothetical protein D3C83_117840 [compost metagenome]